MIVKDFKDQSILLLRTLQQYAKLLLSCLFVNLRESSLPGVIWARKRATHTLNGHFRRFACRLVRSGTHLVGLSQILPPIKPFQALPMCVVECNKFLAPNSGVQKSWCGWNTMRKRIFGLSPRKALLAWPTKCRFQRLLIKLGNIQLIFDDLPADWFVERNKFLASNSGVQKPWCRWNTMRKRISDLSPQKALFARPTKRRF